MNQDPLAKTRSCVSSVVNPASNDDGRSVRALCTVPQRRLVDYGGQLYLGRSRRIAARFSPMLAPNSITECTLRVRASTFAKSARLLAIRCSRAVARDVVVPKIASPKSLLFSSVFAHFLTSNANPLRLLGAA